MFICVHFLVISLCTFQYKKCFTYCFTISLAEFTFIEYFDIYSIDRVSVQIFSLWIQWGEVAVVIVLLKKRFRINKLLKIWYIKLIICKILNNNCIAFSAMVWSYCAWHPVQKCMCTRMFFCNKLHVRIYDQMKKRAENEERELSK